MKRDAELSWATERIESALFRERINDVAYEVVRITQALESPGSSIEPMSAYPALVMGHGGEPKHSTSIVRAARLARLRSIRVRSPSEFVPCGR